VELIDFRFVLRLLFVGYLTSISVSWSAQRRWIEWRMSVEMDGQDRGLVETLSGYLYGHNEDIRIRQD
jgi:hypothetical protein